MRMPVKFRQSLRALPLICCLMPPAHAQLSGSAGLVSNYMYRGITLSADKPAARLSLNYDAASGWYAGGQMVSGQLAVESHRSAQWIGYAGYAQRLASGLSWDAGMTAYAFPAASRWNFRELYVGLGGERYNLRLHYAPDYLGLGERTLYAEVNGGSDLARRLQAFWHAGYLHAPSNAASSRAEARVGLATAWQGWQGQLSLDMVRLREPAGGIYGTVDSSVRHKFVLSLARTF